MWKAAAARRGGMTSWQPSSAGVTERRAIRFLVNSRVWDMRWRVREVLGAGGVYRPAFIRSPLPHGKPFVVSDIAVQRERFRKGCHENVTSWSCNAPVRCEMLAGRRVGPEDPLA